MADNEFTDAKDGLKQEAPEMITRTIKVEGLTDLDKLVEEMEKIDEDQTNNMDKMYALDVFYGGKRSNPYFTLCKLLQELNNKLEKQ
jgi:hypothetical protein|tara:strand:- start:77 stop:337 length:261 start_codon:yes stop_codon:yes gene_type:complete